MTLDGSIRRVEVALKELQRAIAGSDGWADKQRSEFDATRIQPLETHGARFLDALRKADEKCAKANHLLK